MSPTDNEDKRTGEREPDRRPEQGSQLEEPPQWERGHQGRARHGTTDPGPAGIDQAPAEFADDQGGAPGGDPVVDQERPEGPQTRQPPLVGSGDRPAADGDLDDATGGAKP